MERLYYTYEQITKILPVRSEDSHKGSCGKLLLIAGSRNMAGAAYLAAKAAYRSGAGLVYIYTAEANRVILQQLIPEAVLYTYPDGKPDHVQLLDYLKGKDAIAIGPGIGISEEMKAVVACVLQSELPVILDADGLNNLSGCMEVLANKRCNLIITPHVMEMSRLCKKKIPEIKEKLEEIAADFSKEYKVITVLKDHHTVVTEGTCIYRNQTGNHGMATGGSGDVLSGVIGSLLAQGMESFRAAIAGVYLHGKAGDDAAAIYGKRSLMAGDIADYVFRGI